METSIWKIKVKGDIQVTVPADTGNQITYILLEQEDWCEPEIEFVRRFIQPEMTAKDMATGHGFYALTMARQMQGQGKVIALHSDKLFEESLHDKGLQELVTTEDEDTAVDFIRLGNSPADKTLAQGGDPLIMFPGRQELLQFFRDQEMDIFRYVPGLNALIPYGQENNCLFACKPSKTRALNDQDILLANIPKQEAEANLKWQDIVSNFTYAEGLIQQWESGSIDPEYEKALNCYLSSIDENLSLVKRCLLLQQSLNQIQSIEQDHIAYKLLQMRVLSELGLRQQTAAIAGQVLKEMGQGSSIKMDRPFLPPIKDFDERPVRGGLGKWLSASIMETLEKHRAYTTWQQPEKHLPLLNHIYKLPDHSLEMERRLALCALRLGKNIDIQENTRLLGSDHFNLEVWKKIKDNQGFYSQKKQQKKSKVYSIQAYEKLIKQDKIPFPESLVYNKKEVSKEYPDLYPYYPSLSFEEVLSNKVDKFENAAVVFNSGLILNKKYGPDIDRNDIVIKINFMPSKGFEEYVGEKITIRVLGREWIFQEGDEILIHTYNSPNYLKSDIKNLGNSFNLQKAYLYACKHSAIQKLFATYLGGMMTNGFRSVVIALSLCSNVFIYGADPESENYIKGKPIKHFPSEKELSYIKNILSTWNIQQDLGWYFNSFKNGEKHENTHSTISMEYCFYRLHPRIHIK